MNPNYTLSKIELRLHETSFIHSYLVLDNEKNEVYLSHRDYSGEENNFFCTKEYGIPIWKYTMCLVVIEKWEEIKEILHNELEKITTVDELCENFEI